MRVMSNVLGNFSRTPGAPCQLSASKSGEALGEISLTELGTSPSSKHAMLAWHLDLSQRSTGVFLNHSKVCFKVC